MNDDTLIICKSCHQTLPRYCWLEYDEPDIDWRGLRCPNCLEIDNWEEVNAAFAIRTILSLERKTQTSGGIPNLLAAEVNAAIEWLEQEKENDE